LAPAGQGDAGCPAGLEKPACLDWLTLDWPVWIGLSGLSCPVWIGLFGLTGLDWPVWIGMFCLSFMSGKRCGADPESLKAAPLQGACQEKAPARRPFAFSQTTWHALGFASLRPEMPEDDFIMEMNFSGEALFERFSFEPAVEGGDEMLQSWKGEMLEPDMLNR
jgi:hypothetical protein